MLLCTSRSGIFGSIPDKENIADLKGFGTVHLSFVERTWKGGKKTLFSHPELQVVMLTVLKFNLTGQ